MKVRSRHERVVAAPPERIAPLISNFDHVWPTQITPAPRSLGHRLYQSGPMLWEELDRPGRYLAFRVIRPDGFQVEHWFDLERVQGGTLCRHTLEGQALGTYEAEWLERIEPFHGRVLEAVLDNIEAALAED